MPGMTEQEIARLFREYLDEQKKASKGSKPRVPGRENAAPLMSPGEKRADLFLIILFL